MMKPCNIHYSHFTKLTSQSVACYEISKTSFLFFLQSHLKTACSNHVITTRISLNSHQVACYEVSKTVPHRCCRQAAVIVVNVEYRLAPEFKFPCQMDDGCAAMQWVLDNRTTVGVYEMRHIV